MNRDWFDEIEPPDDGPDPLAEPYWAMVERARELKTYGWRTVGRQIAPIVMERRQGWFGRRRRIQILVRTTPDIGGFSYVSIEGIGWTIRGENELR